MRRSRRRPAGWLAAAGLLALLALLAGCGAKGPPRHSGAPERSAPPDVLGAREGTSSRAPRLPPEARP